MLPPAGVVAAAVIRLACIFDGYNELLCPLLTVGMLMIVNDESQIVSMLFSLDHDSFDETLTHHNPIQCNPILPNRRERNKTNPIHNRNYDFSE